MVVVGFLKSKFAMSLALASVVMLWSSPANAAPSQPFPMCDGHIPTIIGSPGQKAINGTDGQDFIYVASGGHAIYGKGGDDRICSDTGYNSIFGGEGNDLILIYKDSGYVEAGP